MNNPSPTTTPAAADVLHYYLARIGEVISPEADTLALMDRLQSLDRARRETLFELMVDDLIALDQEEEAAGQPLCVEVEDRCGDLVTFTFRGGF